MYLHKQWIEDTLLTFMLINFLNAWGRKEQKMKRRSSIDGSENMHLC